VFAFTGYSPKTNSTVALRCSLSSGILPKLLINQPDTALAPDAIARYLSVIHTGNSQTRYF
jgi:hypothetical protein